MYDHIHTQISSKDGFIREEFLAPLQSLPEDKKYEVTFNDLTTREDCGMRDQAIETIDQAISKCKLINSQIRTESRVLNKYTLNRKYQDISISILQINSKIIKEFINPDIEIHEATKEEAMVLLKDNSSFFHCHLLQNSLFWDSYKVNLEIILNDNVVKKEKKEIQIRDAIEIIEKENQNARDSQIINERESNQNQDENKINRIHFNVTLISANEIAKVLIDNVINHAKLTVEFIDLTGSKVSEKVMRINSESINLAIFDKKEQLLKVIQSVNNTQVIEWYSSGNEEANFEKSKELVNKMIAEKRIKNTSNEALLIGLRGANKEAIVDVIQICQHAKFNISFIDVNVKNLLNGFEDELVNIHFDKLEKDTAKILIEQLRKKNLDFALTFKNLENNQVKQLIGIAPIDQENIQITKVKNLRELFMNELRPDLELSEFSGRGIEYLIEISEKKPIPWFSIAAVTSLAIIQMTVGVILTTTGFGATIGMASITEGAADLFTAYRAYHTRNFTWSDYGKQKAVSLIISAFSMGLSAIKDASKGIQTLVTEVEREVLEQADVRIITNGKTVGQVLAATGKNLKTLAIKQVGVKIGENTVREGLNKIADISSHFVLEQVKPQVSASIQSKVSDIFREPNLLKIVRKMYALDKMNKEKKLEKTINKTVADVINPGHSFWREQSDSVGSSLCRGILSSADRIGSPATMVLRILGTLNGMHEITFIIERVRDKLLEKLSEIDQETLSIDHILNHYCGVQKKHISEVVCLLERHGILDAKKVFDDEHFSEKLRHTSINEFPMYKEKVVTFLNLLHNVEFDDLSKLMKSVSDMITEQIFRIMESQFISPWSSYCMGALTKYVSERVQDYCIVDERQNSDSQNLENQERGGEILNTIARQIQYNARDYTIAYSQSEIIYYSNQQGRNAATSYEIIDKETKKYIASIREDKPANLSDLIALSDKYGLNLKLVDDANYQPTEEDKINGMNIVVYTKGEKDERGIRGIGSFRLMSADGSIIDIESKNNDCGYCLIQKLLNDQGINMFISSLRNERAQIMEDNPRRCQSILNAERWITTHYPEEAASLLMIGSNKISRLSADKKLKTMSNNKNKTIFDNFEKGVQEIDRNSPCRPLQAQRKPQGINLR
ncbi:unnamed protein product, partial [Rotaria sp. Silwood2]